MLPVIALHSTVDGLKSQVAFIIWFACGTPFTNSRPKTVSFEDWVGVALDTHAQICALPISLHATFAPTGVGGNGGIVAVPGGTGVLVRVGVRRTSVAVAGGRVAVFVEANLGVAVAVAVNTAVDVGIPDRIASAVRVSIWIVEVGEAVTVIVPVSRAIKVGMRGGNNLEREKPLPQNVKSKRKVRNAAMPPQPASLTLPARSSLSQYARMLSIRTFSFQHGSDCRSAV